MTAEECYLQLVIIEDLGSANTSPIQDGLCGDTLDTPVVALYEWSMRYSKQVRLAQER